MAGNITNLILLTFLISTTISKEIQFQDKNNFGKENLSDDSKPRSYISERKTREHYGLKHGNLLDEDSRSNEQDKQKNKQRSRNNRVNLTKNLEQETSEHRERNKDLVRKDLIRLKQQNTSLHKNQERNLLEESRSSRDDDTSEHLGRNKNLDEDSRPTQSEQNDLDEYGNSKEFVDQDTRPSLDTQKTERHINLNKGSLQTIILEQNDKNPDFNDVNNKPSLNTPENYNLNNETTPNFNEQTTAHHRHLNVDRRVGNRDHTAVADNEFEYMVAVLKGNTYVCAGALIDESWVLTAASGIHL